MPTLLHLDASANRSGASITRRLGATFASAWRAAHGPNGYRYRDLAAAPVAPITTGYCTLGRRVEQHPPMGLDEVGALAASAEERQEWAETRPLIEEVLAADVVLLGAPMYNYGLPALLKAWIDRITFPGAFLDPSSRAPRLAATEVVIVAASGGTYGSSSGRQAWDHQLPHLRTWLSSIGVRPEAIHAVRAELTLAALVDHLAEHRPEAERSMAVAEAELAALAARLSPAAVVR